MLERDQRSKFGMTIKEHERQAVKILCGILIGPPMPQDVVDAWLDSHKKIDADANERSLINALKPSDRAAITKYLKEHGSLPWEVK